MRQEENQGFTNSQVKKRLNKESVSATSKAAGSADKTRAKNGPMNLASWHCWVILTRAVIVDTGYSVKSDR